MFNHEPFQNFQVYNTAYLICRRPTEDFSQFTKNAKVQIFHDTFQHTAMLFLANMYISSYAVRLFICCSVTAIVMQIGADI